ncbi:hypothetical protein [Phyllobacterium phragmitis]|uniref:Uncharacterized protein n=1 Tax=Phyllobacterium phragmitis TaxID=2670329 RepID=A0ABQ0H5J5_9HYPH
MTKYKMPAPRRTNLNLDRVLNRRQAVDSLFMAAMDADGAIGQLSQAGIALLIERAIAAGWTYQEIAAALIQLTSGHVGNTSVTPQRSMRKRLGSAIDIMHVDPPNLAANHVSRMTECVYVLEPLFLALAAGAVRAGWGEHETAVALAEIALREVHGIKRKVQQGSC